MYYVIQTPVYFKMLKECVKNEEYAEAFKTRGPHNSAESLFMALIFYQKMISKLMQSLRSNQNKYLLLFYNLSNPIYQT